MRNKYYDTAVLTMLQINYLVNKLAHNEGIKPKTTMFFAHKVRSYPFIYISDGVVTFTGCPDGDIMDLPRGITGTSVYSVNEWLDERCLDGSDVLKKCINEYYDHLTEDDCWLWHDYAMLTKGKMVEAAIAFYIDMQYLPWSNNKRVI